MYNGVDNSTVSPDTRVFLTVKASDFNDFSIPMDVSDAPTGINVYHVSAFVATGRTSLGDISVAWMDSRTSEWNVYYRESKNTVQHGPHL